VGCLHHPNPTVTVLITGETRTQGNMWRRLDAGTRGGDVGPPGVYFSPDVLGLHPQGDRVRNSTMSFWRMTRIWITAAE